MKQNVHIFLLVFTLMSNCSALSSKTQVKIGSIAPDFSLMDDANTLRTVSSMQGSRIALCFYPKNNSPWCTKQACSLNDSFQTLRDQNIHVWGINYDSTAAHAAFKAKYNLTFPLLSDTDKAVTIAYGVNGWFFAQRVTFLINEQGIIVDIITDVDVKNHAQQILNHYAAR